MSGRPVVLGGGGSVDGGTPSVGIYESAPYYSGGLTAWAICGPVPAGYEVPHHQATGLGEAVVQAYCPTGQKVLGAGGRT